MIKKLSENMRPFSFANKETYNYQDVVQLLEDQKRGLVSYFDKEVITKLDELASEQESLTSKNTELEDSVKALTEEKEKLETNVDTLSSELTPFKEQSKKVTAIELLKGKVVEGAELDAFDSLNLEGFDEVEEDKKEEFVNNALNGLFETKKYFKPQEVVVDGVSDKVLQVREGQETKQTKVNSVVNGIIT